MVKERPKDSPIDERCFPHPDNEAYEQVHPWADAIDENCTPIGMVNKDS